MITQFVADRVRSEALFRSVALEEAGVETAYMLKGTIERLEDVDQGSDVRAVCTISAQLIDAKTKSIIWSDAASQTVMVQNRSVAGVVSSLSAAVRMSVDNLVKSMEHDIATAKSQLYRTNIRNDRHAARFSSPSAFPPHRKSLVRNRKFSGQLILKGCSILWLLDGRHDVSAASESSQKWFSRERHDSETKASTNAFSS